MLINREPLGHSSRGLRGITNPPAPDALDIVYALGGSCKENRDGLKKLGLKLVEGSADVVFKVWY